MAGLAEALGGILTMDKFMGTLVTLIPVVGGVLLFAFVYKTVKKLIKGASKGKASI